MFQDNYSSGECFIYPYISHDYSYNVEMVPNQMKSEMVVDGGGHFIPAGIFGLHTLSLLLTSLVAHDCATEVTHTHIRKEHQSTNIEDTTVNVGTVHKPRQGDINSFPL